MKWTDPSPNRALIPFVWKEYGAPLPSVPNEASGDFGPNAKPFVRPTAVAPVAPLDHPKVLVFVGRKSMSDAGRHPAAVGVRSGRAGTAADQSAVLVNERPAGRFDHQQR